LNQISYKIFGYDVHKLVLFRQNVDIQYSGNKILKYPLEQALFNFLEIQLGFITKIFVAENTDNCADISVGSQQLMKLISLLLYCIPADNNFLTNFEVFNDFLDRAKSMHINFTFIILISPTVQYQIIFYLRICNANK